MQVATGNWQPLIIIHAFHISAFTRSDVHTYFIQSLGKPFQINTHTHMHAHTHTHTQSQTLQRFHIITNFNTKSCAENINFTLKLQMVTRRDLQCSIMYHCNKTAQYDTVSCMIPRVHKLLLQYLKTRRYKYYTLYNIIDIISLYYL